MSQSANNTKTPMWIAIIISVVVVAISLSVGIIRTSNEHEIQAIQKRVTRHEEAIGDMREANVRNETRLDNVQRSLEHLNKKMDIVLQKLK